MVTRGAVLLLTVRLRGKVVLGYVVQCPHLSSGRTAAEWSQARYELCMDGAPQSASKAVCTELSALRLLLLLRAFL